MNSNSTGFLVPTSEKNQIIFKKEDPFNKEDFDYNDQKIAELVESHQTCDYHVIHKSDVIRLKSNLINSLIHYMKLLHEFHPDVMTFKTSFYKAVTQDVELFFNETKASYSSSSSGIDFCLLSSIFLYSSYMFFVK